MENTEKRSVHTDALETLGNLIDNNQHRDAIHLAVEPIEAMERLKPGEHVGIIDGKASKHAEKKLGIVDPFITGSVPEGSMFWLIIYPRQITSLRHVWSHPEFPEPTINIPQKMTTEQAKSRIWIETFAQSVGLKYDVIMQGADDMVRSRKQGGWGEYLCFGPLLDGESVPMEFWDHYEKVTGETVEEDHRRSFFTCSC